MPPDRASGPSSADIDGFLAWNLTRLGHGVELLLTEAIGRHDLTTRQFGVLALLNAYDGLTQSDLARAVLVRVQSIGAIVDSLVDRGLIVRRGPAGRGRRSAFDLTGSGRQLLDRAWRDVTATTDPASLGLSHEQSEQLASLLATVLQTIGQPGRPTPAAREV